MSIRYKAIISSKNLYKEIELPADLVKVKVGTGTECDVRLRKELFFTAVSLEFIRNEKGWTIICSDNIYLSVGDVRKLLTKQLIHGDELTVKYSDSNTEIFAISYFIDFDYLKKPYNVALDLSGKSEILIGGTEKCDVILKSQNVKDDMFCIKYDGQNYILCEDNSKYGVYLNGKRNTGETILKYNDFIDMAEFSFCIADKILYTSQNVNMRIDNLKSYPVIESQSEYSYPKFNRSTRIKIVLGNEKISILDPPAAPQKPTGNIVMRLMPAIVMLAVTIVMRGLMSSAGNMYVWVSVISMGIGVITSIAGIIDERKKYKTEVTTRTSSYEAYIENKDRQIQELREKEADQLEEIYYSLENEIQFVSAFSAELFDRNTKDDDFLSVRLGTGTNKAVREIDIRKQEKFEGEDELAALPGQLAQRYENIANTPVTLNLQKKNAVGIIGNRKGLLDILRNLTIDLAVRHYYLDLKLFYIIGENQKKEFEWLRFLPHIQNDILHMRNLVCDEGSKTLLFEYLYKELSKREAAKISFPRIVIFVFNDMGIKKHPISRYIDRSAALGVTFIFFEECREFIPNGCSDLVSLSEDGAGMITCAQNKEIKKEFVFEPIESARAEEVVKKLAPVYCEEVSLEGTLTKNITLFELLNIMGVDDIDLDKNWSESAVYKSMAAPLGVKTKNEIVFLDLNEKKHGPHGLVAGTTGSGKSEILQTYILSMALLFHPYEVGFVIIDFKGGGMVNQFKDLPHLIGSITNIDGREINRSLLSIKAELRKRQELFAEYGVNHIDAYIKLYKKGETSIPLPHLILIVDEFAELKMDQPEFMKELISAARIGRSLGVHLILATQKPSGVVDAQIWSNSKFKLCLKVQSKEDSNEVLKTPVAAEIKEPGRAYLQVGNNEVFELFQSAYSGAPASADDNASAKAFVLSEVELSGKRNPIYIKKEKKNNEERDTQLTAIVNYIASYCNNMDIVRLPGICLPPLKDMIVYPASKSREEKELTTVIPVGIYDDPDNQMQGEVTLNIQEGHTMIVGSSQYGKTNLLQTVIRGLSDQYTPEEVNIYILDFGSMALKVFDQLNHVGGVIVASEDEKMKNFTRMINLEIKDRKERFSKMAITSFASYREAGRRDLPQIVIIVDNFIALKEIYSEYEDDLLNICREGIAVGITLLITSLQTNGINYKYMSNFANRICLYCNQGDEYGTMFDRCRMSPKNIPGRGLIAIDKQVYEYQTYLAFEGTKEIERVKKIKSYIQTVNAMNGEIRAKRIPEVPQVLDLDYVRQQLKNRALKDMEVPVGIDYDTVEYVTIDLSQALTIGITGKEGYGKTNLVKLFVSYLQSKVFDVPSKVYILDNYKKQLEPLSSYGVVERYSTDLNDFEEIISSIGAELQIRLEIVKEQGMDALKQMEQIVFIIQNVDIYSPDGVGKAAIESFKKICKLYKNMKICFIFAEIENVSIAYGSSEMMKMVKDYKYLFVLDDLANLKLVDINAAVVRKYKKMIELGDGYLITDKGVQKQKIIHMKGDELYEF